MQTHLNGRQLLVKIEVKLEELSYTLLLTDLVNTWEEKVGKEEFESRWQKMNPDLEGMEGADGLKEIRGAVHYLARVSDGSKCDIALKVEADFGQEDKDISLKLNWMSDGLPLHWEATLVMGGAHLVNKTITRPLINCISNLLNRDTTLVNLLHAKDLELEDLRSCGAQVSLPQLRTKWFDSAENYQQGKEVDNPISFLCSPEMCSQLDIKLKKKNGSKQEGGDEKVVSSDIVDGNELKKKKVKVGPLSSPLKLSSKVPVARPDLRKLGVNGTSKEKRAKLDRL